MKLPCTILTRLLPLMFLTSCIPMGLPEEFAPIGIENPLGTALVIRSAQVPAANKGRSAFQRPLLGTQFVFGFVPLTRLYLPHEISEFVDERLVEALNRKGYAVYLASEASRVGAVEALRPDLIVTGNIRDLGVTAYDAFFFRITRVTGTIDLTFLDYDGSIADRRTLALDGTKYKAFAYAPVLSAALHQESRNLIEGILPPPPGHPHRCGRVGAARGVLFVEPPRISGILPAGLGTLLVESYGFHAKNPFSNSVVLRILQRGIVAGSLLEGHEPVAALQPEIGCGNVVWLLRSNIGEISAVGDNLHMTATFSLFEPGAGTDRAPILMRTITLSEANDSGRDGSWVHTAERLGERLADSFFAGKG